MSSVLGLFTGFGDGFDDGGPAATLTMRPREPRACARARASSSAASM